MFRLALAAGLLAAPAYAQTDAEMDRFMAVLAELGCRIDGQTAPMIEQRTGFSDQTLLGIMTALAKIEGAFTQEGNAIRVNVGSCAG